jgi:uncharacterized repeat protein (TIGR01451 family)
VGGAVYPPITVTVNVVAGASSLLTNVVNVSGGGGVTASASDLTVIVSPVSILSVASTHIGSFQRGQASATYSVTVTNAPSASPTSGTVTVTDTIPTGLTLISMQGTGWSCVGNACTRVDPLAAGASYPVITVTVNVAANAQSTVTNTASVSGGGSATASATDQTSIQSGPPVLSVASAHSGSFVPNETNATYLVTVSNSPTGGPTSGPVTVTDTLPIGVTLGSMAGTGWTCNTNTCSRSDVLNGGISYPPIVVTVTVTNTASGTITNSVAVTGGGSASASGTDPTTIAVLPGTPPLLWLGGGHTGGVRAVGTSAGTVWSAGGDGTVKQWNQSNMGMVRTLPLGSMKTAAFSANGQTALVVNGSGTQVTSLVDGSVSRTFTTGDFGSNYLPAISANGQTWAFARSSWAADTFTIVNGNGAEHSFLATPYQPFSGSYGAMSADAVSADGKTVAAVFALDNNDPLNIRLFDAVAGTQTRVLSHNSASVTALAFSPDGTLLASTSSDGKLNILRLSDLVVTGSTTMFDSGSLVSANSLAFSPDGTMIAIGDSVAARIYNVASVTQTVKIPGRATSVAFTPDGLWLAVGTGNDVRLFTTANGAPLPALAPHFGGITAVGYSPKGDLVASASADQTVHVRKAIDGTPVFNLTGHTGAVNAIVFSPDGDLLATASADTTIKVWKTADGTLVQTLTGHTQAILSLAFSPDGSLIASGSGTPEQTVKLWSVGGTWANSGTLTGVGGNVTSLQFSPDGLSLAGASDGGIARVWQVTGGKLLRTYLAPSQGAMSLAFSPDGQTLAAGWQQTILVFQGPPTTPVTTLSAHTRSGTVLAFSPDGSRLLSGNPDGTLKLWNPLGWGSVATYTQETDAVGPGVTSVAWSPDNTRFLYGRGDATIGVVNTGLTVLPITVTINTVPSGLGITVDGVAKTAPFVFTSTPGTSHTIAVVSPQGTSGTRQIFKAWSDGGIQSHLITPVASRIYSASFATQYLLTQQLSPPAGGTVSAVPPSSDGYYNSGTSVQLTANPLTGYVFGSWTGDASGFANPTSVSMTQPRTVTARLSGTTTSDIAVTMAASTNQVNGGTPLSYVIQVSNLGPAVSSATTMTDTLPGGATFVSAIASQGTCTGTVIVSCSLGSVSVGATVTVTIKVTPFATGSIVNTASVPPGTSDPNPANNSATVTVNILPAGQPPILWEGGSPFGANGPDTIHTTTTGEAWVTGNQELMVYRASDMRLLRTIAIPGLETGQQAPGFGLTSDGSYFAAAYRFTRGNSFVNVYRADGSTVANFSAGGYYGIIDVSLSDDGQTVAYTDYGFGNGIGNVSTGKLATGGNGGQVASISPNGKLLATSDDSGRTGIALYSATDFSLARALNALPGTYYLTSVQFSHDGSLVEAASPLGLAVWRLSDLLTLQNFSIPGGGGAGTISYDGTLVAYGGPSSTRVFSVADGTIVATIPSDCHYSVGITTDNRLLVCGGPRISAFALPQGTPVPAKTGNTGSLNALAYSPAGNLIATAGSDSLVSVWDTGAGSVVAQFNVSASNPISGLAYSPDGTKLAAGLDNKVQIWDTTSYGSAATLNGHAASVTAVAFSPDGTLLATASTAPEQVVKLWSTQTWTLVRTLMGASGGLRSVQFSPDGTTVVAAGDDGAARAWKVSTGTKSSSYIATGPGSMRIQYSPDGTKLAAGWTGKVLVFNTGTSSPIQTLNAHTSNNTSVVWSPDGKRLVSGNPDGTIDVWDTATWGQLAQYTQETYLQNGGVLAVTYSPDNSQFAYGRADAVVVAVNSGSSPTGTVTTVSTSPSGLPIVVDGATLTSPQTFRWTAGTTHTVGAVSTTGSGGTRNIFQSWNDGGSASHSITTPSSSTTYSAAYNTQYLLTPAVSPANSGSVLSTPISADGFYDSGAAVQAVAAPNAGYFFGSWSGTVIDIANPVSVSMTGPQNLTATFTKLATHTVTTIPTGLSIVVDGTTYTAPQTFTWTVGTTHVISVPSQQGTRSLRSNFSAWTDSGAISHTVTAPGSSATYTAIFTTQYPLAITSTPANGGSVTASPTSTDGYYGSGTIVTLTAVPATGYQLLNWSGDVAGTTSPKTITMSVARSVTATFSLNGPALAVTSLHSGNFTQGQPAAQYTITVQNTGNGPTSGTVSVADSLPAGLTLVSMTGTGWSCASATCSRADVLAAGSSYPPITGVVSVASNAPSPLVNQVTVSGGGSGSASGIDTLTIVPLQAQTISFGPLNSVAFGVAPFALTASSTSGLAVTLTSNSPAVCSVSVSTVTALTAGTCSITATQPGNAVYSPGTPITQSFTVIGQAQTIAFAAPADRLVGDLAFNVTATASSSLPVTFSGTTPAVCTTSGAQVTLLAAGTCTIVAAQAGNGTFAAAVVVSRSFNVNPGNQSISFPGPADQLLGAAPIALSATATSGLAVSFASTTPSVCTVSSTAVTLIAVGACSVTASQTENANYNAATPVARTFAVNQPVQNATVTLGLGDGSGFAGDTVEIPIQLTSTGLPALSTFQLDLNFDTQKLTFKSARIGAPLTAAGKSLSTNTQPNGDVRLVALGFNQNVIANGVAAYATFTLNSPFSAGVVVLKACTSANAQGTGLNTACTAGTIRLPSCDINVDGSTNVSDVQLIINEALGVSPAIHDLNHDGVVNVADVQKVINAVLGLGCSVP